MKVLLLNGSPNENGCTATALKVCAEILKECGVETEFAHVGTGAIHGCIACFQCEETGRCAFEEDVTNGIIVQAESADGIIVGTPVYYAGPTGAVCSVLERMFTAAGERLCGKPAATVVCCRRNGASATFDRINKFFAYNHMPIVTSQNCWNVVHGQEPDEVLKDEEGLQTLRVLSRNMAWMLRAIDGAKEDRPQPEEWIETSFIR